VVVRQSHALVATSSEQVPLCLACRVKAVTPNVVFLPEHFLSLEIFLVPTWGLYANLIAQLISQISSHFIIHYHRQVVELASKKYEQERHLRKHNIVASITTETIRSVHSKEGTDDHTDDKTNGGSTETADNDKSDRLCDTAFSRPHRGDESRLVARHVASYGLVVVSFLLILFIVLGCFLPSLGSETQGLISFISAVGGPVYNEYSVFDIAAMLMSDAFHLGGFKYVAGYFLLVTILVLTVFAAPILQALVLAYQWFKPMNDNQRERLNVVTEVLGAWQYAEVFVLALLVSAWYVNHKVIVFLLCDSKLDP
jgi:Paraquat-inducible protein A